MKLLISVSEASSMSMFTPVTHGIYAVERHTSVARVVGDETAKNLPLVMMNSKDEDVDRLESEGKLSKRVAHLAKQFIKQGKRHWLALGMEAETAHILNKEPRHLNGPDDARNFIYDTVLLDTQGAKTLMFVLKH